MPRRAQPPRCRLQATTRAARLPPFQLSPHPTTRLTPCAVVLGTGLSGVNFQASQALKSKHDTLDALKSAAVVPAGWEFLPGNATPPLLLGEGIRAQLGGSLVDATFVSEVSPGLEGVYNTGFKFLEAILGLGAANASATNGSTAAAPSAGSGANNASRDSLTLFMDALAAVLVTAPPTAAGAKAPSTAPAAPKPGAAKPGAATTTSTTAITPGAALTPSTLMYASLGFVPGLFNGRALPLPAAPTSLPAVFGGPGGRGLVPLSDAAAALRNSSAAATAALRKLVPGRLRNATAAPAGGNTTSANGTAPAANASAPLGNTTAGANATAAAAPSKPSLLPLPAVRPANATAAAPAAPAAWRRPLNSTAARFVARRFSAFANASAAHAAREAKA